MTSVLSRTIAIAIALLLIAPAASAQLVEGEAEVDSTNPEQSLVVTTLVNEDGNATLNATAQGELVNESVEVSLPPGGAPGVPGLPSPPSP